MRGSSQPIVMTIRLTSNLWSFRSGNQINKWPQKAILDSNLNWEHFLSHFSNFYLTRRRANLAIRKRKRMKVDKERLDLQTWWLDEGRVKTRRSNTMEETFCSIHISSIDFWDLKNSTYRVESFGTNVEQMWGRNRLLQWRIKKEGIWRQRKASHKDKDREESRQNNDRLKTIWWKRKWKRRIGWNPGVRS